MEKIFFKKTAELRRVKHDLEKKLNVKIDIAGRKITITGNPIEEYEASLVLNAINFGFSTQKAISLKDENMIFRIISIKDFTRKKNLKTVRARIIGKEGKTKKTIENISSCYLVIRDNDIGIIGSAESIDEIITAVTNLVRGTKQSNTYRYLEKMNRKITDL